MTKEHMGAFVQKGITPELSVRKELSGCLWRRSIYPVAR